MAGQTRRGAKNSEGYAALKMEPETGYLTVQVDNTGVRRARVRRMSRFRLDQSGELQTRKGGAARRDKTLTAPCRFIEILAGKCGFAGQRERRNDGSGPCGNGNAIPFLT